MNRVGAIAAPVVLLLLLLGLWQGLCVALKVPTYLVPTPMEVGQAIAGNAPLLAASALNTLAMAMAALAIASILGCGLALVVATSGMLEAAAHKLGLSYPPLALLLVVGCVFLLMFYRFSVIISKLRDDNIALAQRLAILEYHLQNLRGGQPHV